MRFIDADGHLEESPATFSDDYLDPAFRDRRPKVINVDGMIYWMLEEQLFPRRLGPGCHNLGTPASFEGKPSPHARKKADTLASMELSDVGERLRAMDEEGISVQVIYPTLFLAYPLTRNVGLMNALCSAYNRFLGDRLGRHDRLKWAAVVNLDDAHAAARETARAKELGAAAVMVLGTAGERMLDDPGLLPFYEAVAAADLALAVHVGWACPPLSNLFTHIYPSSVNAFLFPVLMGYSALISGGILDRFPSLRVAFLEAGSQWIHFMTERLEHRFRHSGGYLAAILKETVPKAKLSPTEYLRQGNLYFAAEAEDALLPQVIELVGDTQVVFGSDMPHGDRERFAGRLLAGRPDIPDSAKKKMLEENALRLYGLGAS
ncbi:MAG TPA: amidohydrolase family protein [candidate division Zixibacteria bacterium]|nr:amidohydrolase family protein [candidate division Zixibacteria bacterium]